MKTIKLFEEFFNESTTLEPAQLEPKKLYEVVVRGDDNYKFQALVLDKNEKHILALDYDYFRIEKDASKLKAVYNLTIDEVKNDGIEDDRLDEHVYLYDVKGNEITTVLGYKVEFEVELM